MSDLLRIAIQEQGWLAGSGPKLDLCSHGKLRIEIDGRLITPTDKENEYGISESALALLRTLVDGHSKRRKHKR